MTDLDHSNDKELIIIRRRQSFDIEKPHSGVWKIAHADFMTAMMAFFMVMWLISSTDDAAKRHIARYFNPVKLSAMTPFPKGLDDPDPKETQLGPETTPPKTSLTKKSKADATQAPSVINASDNGDDGSTLVTDSSANDVPPEGRQLPTYSESELLSDPYGVLDRIAMSEPTQAASAQDVSDAPSSLEPSALSLEGQGGAAMRDPFSPLSWRLNPLSLNETELVDKVTSSAFSITAEDAEDSTQDTSPSGSTDAQTALDRQASAIAMEMSSPTLAKLPQAAGAAKGTDDPDQIGLITGPIPNGKIALGPTPEKGDETDGTGLINFGDASAQNSPLLAQLSAFKGILTKELNQPPRQTFGNEISVTTSGDDMLINVSDSPDYGMFAVGSSEPTARSIALIERIAKSLNQIPGNIIIRGHTDARPFRNGRSDNWRLSTARAHMARFMLIRGGLDEHRLLRVEGYADRALKHPDNPQADDNRRIEILVQPVKESKQ